MKDFVVEIYNIMGVNRLIIENLRSINIDELENGIYFFKLTSKLELSNQFYKFIVWR